MLQIDYIEFPTCDIPSSQAFFERAFGWTFESWGPGYSSFSDGRLNGGLDATGKASETGTMVILYAKDLEDALSRVEAAVATSGGSITKPIYSFPGGRRFEFQDPSGNALAVWSDTGVEEARAEDYQ